MNASDPHAYTGEANDVTIRDYYATRAPLEIPSWFDPKFPHLDDPARPTPPAQIAEAVSKWEDDPCYALCEHFEAGEGGNEGNPTLAAMANEYETQVNAWAQECSQLRNDRLAARYFAWRFAYADGLLSVRKLPTPTAPERQAEQSEQTTAA